MDGGASAWAAMYLYIGRVDLAGVRGYLWLLGRRLYLKTGWRPGETHYLGRLEDPLSIAVRLRRFLPRPIDVRHAVALAAKALKAALYLADRCRPSPRWRIQPWEAKAMALDALHALAALWPATVKRAKPG